MRKARSKILLVMGALSVAVIFTVGALLPDVRSARGASQESQALMAAIDGQTYRLQTLADRQQEADEIRTKLSDFDIALPNTQRIGAFLEAIEQIARDVGVTGKNVRPEEPIAATDAACLPVNVDVTGTFAAVHEFVRRVEALPRIARVQRLELVGPGEDGSEIRSSVTINVYFRPS